jgi:hypothetical protein
MSEKAPSVNKIPGLRGELFYCAVLSPMRVGPLRPYCARYNAALGGRRF